MGTRADYWKIEQDADPHYTNVVFKRYWADGARMAQVRLLWARPQEHTPKHSISMAIDGFSGSLEDLPFYRECVDKAVEQMREWEARTAKQPDETARQRESDGVPSEEQDKGWPYG